MAASLDADPDRRLHCLASLPRCQDDGGESTKDDTESLIRTFLNRLLVCVPVVTALRLQYTVSTLRFGDFL